MLLDQLSADMKTAMKAGDKARLSVIRMLISELKNARIAAGDELDEAAENKVLASYAKKRKEAVESARDSGRDDIADREEYEYDVTISYLPKQMDEQELRAIVGKVVEQTGASGPQEFGKVMKLVMEEVAGKADGKAVSAIVREVLS